MAGPLVVGIVNITSDSFSDGGRFLDPTAAMAHAKELLRDGADIVELGAASSNPNAGVVTAKEEIVRLTPVLDALSGTRISIDTAKAEVQRFAMTREVEIINDVAGFPDHTLYPDLAASRAKLVVMHSISDSDRAIKAERTVEEVFESIRHFLAIRIQALLQAGVSKERIIVDPGMGFFLSTLPEPSFAVLERLQVLKQEFSLPMMISVSRKSFLRRGAELGSDELRARTLEAELLAVKNAADYIRTHEPKQLKEALSGGSLLSNS